MVVPICLPSEQAVGLANLKLKSDPYLGHGPMGKKLPINIMEE